MKRTYSTLTAVFFSLIIFAQSQPNLSYTEFPGNNIIGRGYNVFDEYATISSIKRYPIFNFSKCSLKVENGYSMPNILYLEPFLKHDIKDIKGSSAHEYSDDLAKRTNLKANALFFSGSFKSNFNSNTNESENRYYQTRMDLNLQWKISLDNRDESKLIKYLDEDFYEDLMFQKPEIIFERYGTHVIVSALLGGRIDYSLSQRITDQSSSASVENKINARYQILRGEISNTQNAYSGSYDSNEDVKLNIIGGNSQFINNIKDNVQYNVWAEGIQNNSTLCDFTEESLIPIWSFAPDDKKQELMNYYSEVWIKKYPIPIPEKPSIKELEIVISKVYIKNSCESAIKSYGEFQMLFLVNGIQQDQTREAKGSEGSNCNFDKMSFKFKAPINPGETVSVELKLIEIDQTGNDELTMGDRAIVKINYPINEAILNVNTAKYLYKQDGIAGRYCEVNINYYLRKSE